MKFKYLRGGVHADWFIFFKQGLYGSLLPPRRAECDGAALLPAVSDGGQGTRSRGGRHEK